MFSRRPGLVPRPKPEPAPPRPRRPRTPPKLMELIRDAQGHQEWVGSGQRWLVMVQHDENRPLHVLPAESEEIARAMVGRAAEFHAADPSQCLVHFWTEAVVVASVQQSVGYGMNGRVGRAKTLASNRRYERECAAAEGIDPEDRVAMRARKAATWAEMDDDITLYGRLRGNQPRTQAEGG